MRGAWRERLRRSAERFARPRMPEALPVRLDRRRVYVLPTGFGLFLGALLLTMLLGALNYNNNPALLLALLLGAVALASLMAAHLTLSGLRLDSLGAEPVSAGQPLRLRLALSARDARTRRGLRFDHGPAHAFLALPAGATREAELSIATTQRGWLDLGRIRISTTQPLGLARAWSWIWPEQPLLIYPQAEQNGPPLPHSQGGAKQARLHPLGSDVHHLREYRPGDAQRSIAWKASARRDALMVREVELPQGQVVVLDWRELATLPYEARIARLAHWVERAEREGRRYALRLPGQPTLGPAHGAEHRHLCLRALALLPHG